MRALGVAARPLRRLDHALGRISSRLQVLVDVRTPMNLAVLRPVWSALRGDPRVSLWFTAEDMEEVAGALKREGLESSLLERDAARWRRFDLSLSADAWNQVDLRRCRSRLNFFHGVAGKYDLDNPGQMGAAGLDRFDRIAFINVDRLRKWVDAGAVSARQAVLVGFPKLDDVVNQRWARQAVHESLGLDASLGTVLYAPTFSTAGSLHAAGEAIVASLLATGRNVIVKLHDRSLVPHPRYTGGIDWRDRFRSLAHQPRFAFAEQPDAGPLLTASDVMVTDHSSVGFEFALLDRPLVVFDAPELQRAARIAVDKWELLRSMAVVVRSVEALGPAISYGFAHPEHRHGERAAARELFAYPGQATERAVAVAYELLDVAPFTAHGSRHEPHIERSTRTSAPAGL